MMKCITRDDKILSVKHDELYETIKVILLHVQAEHVVLCGNRVI